MLTLGLSGATANISSFLVEEVPAQLNIDFYGTDGQSQIPMIYNGDITLTSSSPDCVPDITTFYVDGQSSTAISLLFDTPSRGYINLTVELDDTPGILTTTNQFFVQDTHPCPPVESAEHQIASTQADFIITPSSCAPDNDLDKYVVLLKETSAPGSFYQPEDGIELYPGIVHGSTMVIYVGSDTSVTYNGLTPGVQYDFAVLNVDESLHYSDYILSNLIP